MTHGGLDVVRLFDINGRNAACFDLECVKLYCCARQFSGCFGEFINTSESYKVVKMTCHKLKCIEIWTSCEAKSVRKSISLPDF